MSVDMDDVEVIRTQLVMTPVSSRWPWSVSDDCIYIFIKTLFWRVNRNVSDEGILNAHNLQYNNSGSVLSGTAVQALQADTMF